MTETEFAEALARWMHRDQIDKSGRPYVEHLERVVSMVSEEAKPAAWLHDIVEDTDCTVQRLDALGFAIRTFYAVGILTKEPGKLYSDYIDRLAHIDGYQHCGEIAREVKIADLRDNLSEDRRYEGDESMRKRYKKALEILTGAVA